MADPVIAWTRRSAWAGLVEAEPIGPRAGLDVTPVEHGSLVGLAAGDGRIEALRERLVARFGLLPPAEPRVVSAAGLDLIWSGRSQWLAAAPDAGLAERVEAETAGLAAVVDHTDSRGVLRLQGPGVREVLAKGVNLDLHPRAFPPGSAALTAVAHVPVQLWLRDEAESGGPAFELAVPRSYAGSLWSWLRTAAA